MSKLFFSIATSSFVLLISCSQGTNQNHATNLPPAGLAGTSATIPNHASIGSIDENALAKQKLDRPVVTGKILEAIYKDTYAYLKLEQSGKDAIWVAVVNKKPIVGQTISIQEQAILKDFHSRSLDRTFDKIVFGPVVE